MKGTSGAEGALLEGNALWTGPPGVLARAAAVAAVGWLPLAMLSGMHSVVEPQAVVTFASDFGVHARSALAAPLLVAAERTCAPYLAIVARQFLDAGVIAPHDRERFQLAARATRRLSRSTLAQVVVIALAYGLIAALMIGAPKNVLPAWHRGAPGYSPAGWWHMLVSLPLLVTLLLGWMWRVILWTRFLWQVSRLELRLIPAHPDRAGGLLFVALSMRAFWILAFATGTAVAGAVANGVVHEGRTLQDYHGTAIAVAAFALAVFGGPVLVLNRALLRARWRGIVEYGAIAETLGRQFERKWLHGGRKIEADALEVPDFSALTDLYASVGNVYNMRFVVADMKGVVLLAGAAVLPFAPVVVLAVPLDELIDRLTGLLL